MTDELRIEEYSTGWAVIDRSVEPHETNNWGLLAAGIPDEAEARAWAEHYRRKGETWLRDRVFEVLDIAASDPGVGSVGDSARSVADFLQQYAGHLILGVGHDDLHARSIEELAPHCAAWLDKRQTEA